MLFLNRSPRPVAPQLGTVLPVETPFRGEELLRFGRETDGIHVNRRGILSLGAINAGLLALPGSESAYELKSFHKPVDPRATYGAIALARLDSPLSGALERALYLNACVAYSGIATAFRDWLCRPNYRLGA